MVETVRTDADLYRSSELDSVSDDFPEEFLKMKVLPELLKSIEFGGGGPKVFGVVMKISSKLVDEDYDARVTPGIVRLFSSPDRAIRVCLLDNLPLMIDRLSQKVVNDKIFPQMVYTFFNRVYFNAKSGIGHRLHRCRPGNPRTDCQGSVDRYHKAVRSYCKRRATEVSSENFK